MDHGDADHGFAGLCEILVILGQAAVAPEPGEGPLYDPPLRQEEEALRALGPPDNVEANLAPGPQRPYPGDERPSIGLIGPNQAQAGEPVPQDGQQGHGALTILDMGGGHDHREE